MCRGGWAPRRPLKAGNLQLSRRRVRPPMERKVRQLGDRAHGRGLPAQASVLPAGSPKKMRCAVRRPSSRGRSTDGRSVHQVLDAARNQFLQRPAGTERGGWRHSSWCAAGAQQQGPWCERQHARPSQQAGARDQPVVSRGAGSRILASCWRSRGVHGQQQGGQRRNGHESCKGRCWTVRWLALSVCVPLQCGIERDALAVAAGAARHFARRSCRRRSAVLVAGGAPKCCGWSARNPARAPVRWLRRNRTASGKGLRAATAVGLASCRHVLRRARTACRCDAGGCVVTLEHRAETASRYRSVRRTPHAACRRSVSQYHCRPSFSPAMRRRSMTRPTVVRLALGRMRHIAAAAGTVARRGSEYRRCGLSCTVLQRHVSFHLVEELLAGIDVEVAARIGSADHHDDEVAIRIQQLVADRRFEQVPV